MMQLDEKDYELSWDEEVAGELEEPFDEWGVEYARAYHQARLEAEDRMTQDMGV